MRMSWTYSGSVPFGMRAPPARGGKALTKKNKKKRPILPSAVSLRLVCPCEEMPASPPLCLRGGEASWWPAKLKKKNECRETDHWHSLARNDFLGLSSWMSLLGSSLSLLCRFGFALQAYGIAFCMTTSSRIASCWVTHDTVDSLRPGLAVGSCWVTHDTVDSLRTGLAVGVVDFLLDELIFVYEMYWVWVSW